MSTLCELLGFALIALWAAFVFGWPAALLAVGVEALIVAFALERPRSRGDDQATL